MKPLSLIGVESSTEHAAMSLLIDSATSNTGSNADMLLQKKVKSENVD